MTGTDSKAPIELFCIRHDGETAASVSHRPARAWARPPCPSHPLTRMSMSNSACIPQRGRPARSYNPRYLSSSILLCRSSIPPTVRFGERAPGGPRQLSRPSEPVRSHTKQDECADEPMRTMSAQWGLLFTGHGMAYGTDVEGGPQEQEDPVILSCTS